MYVNNSSYIFADTFSLNLQEYTTYHTAHVSSVLIELLFISALINVKCLAAVDEYIAINSSGICVYVYACMCMITFIYMCVYAC